MVLGSLGPLISFWGSTCVFDPMDTDHCVWVVACQVPVCEETGMLLPDLALWQLLVASLSRLEAGIGSQRYIILLCCRVGKASRLQQTSHPTALLHRKLGEKNQLFLQAEGQEDTCHSHMAMFF